MMKKEENNVFKAAVESSSEISTAYKLGLKALKRSDASKIQVSDTRKLNGSVDLDYTLKTLYPDANRWDYVIGYDSKVCFVEVHPAYTSEITTVAKKYIWLKKWLKEKASDLNSLPRMMPAFVWIQSGKCAILPTSKHSKQLAVIGMPRPMLKL